MGLRRAFMLQTISEAKAHLESQKLHVASNDAHSLWIANTIHDTGTGINISNDACSLLWNAGEWVAVFPAEGLLTYEVHGTLSESVSLIVRVYGDYRQLGGSLNDAFKRIMPNPEQYVVGRSLAHV
jgi:hypothetical protein